MSVLYFALKISQHLPETVPESPRVKVQVKDSVVTGDLILSYSSRVWKYARIDAADTLGKLTTLGGSMKLASLRGNKQEL